MHMFVAIIKSFKVTSQRLEMQAAEPESLAICSKDIFMNLVELSTVSIERAIAKEISKTLPRLIVPEKLCHQRLSLKRKRQSSSFPLLF